MQKFKKSFFVRGDTDDYCLVDLAEVVDAFHKGVKTEDYKMSISTGWKVCEAKSKEYAMKLCKLKGKEDRRVAYRARVHVPKSCFRISNKRFSPDGKSGAVVLQAAVSAGECNTIMSTR